MAAAGERLLIAGVAVSAASSAVAIGLLANLSLVAIAAAIAMIAAVSALALMRMRDAQPQPRGSATDWTLVRTISDAEGVPVLLVDRDGHVICANHAFEERFGRPDLAAVPFSPEARGQIADLTRSAWQNGIAHMQARLADGQCFNISATRAGWDEPVLVWRFAPDENYDRAAGVIDAISGDIGERLGNAGIMAAVIDEHAGLLAINEALALRATGGARRELTSNELDELLALEDGRLRFVIEGPAASPLRLFQIPLADEGQQGPSLAAIVDDDSAIVSAGGDETLHTLLSMLPFGLALADRDGRFLYINQAFMRAGGVPAGSMPVYPSDLVIGEDKAAVADAVRRFTLGRSSQGDIAIRLKARPDDPIAMTVAGTRGLGEAAVLLSLKDNTEETRLQREVAQATKMQAVGQLAGGVAHDFNNILTGIIGHCDLMLMRHSPGDSDYDDIQQIRLNSNRAASLTRQLLAFSRQQTLRPQVLQLPDVVSEVSNLLKRLLGETVDLVIQHGRGMAPVRADPGQLEQVIVNLAVNARDAMHERGTLTLQTYAMSAADVRRLGSDVLPIADYVALRMTDTGTGIPEDLLGKIFEPFFTTKEVGKGTGLGLSTVYGIVKQSGGFIFAENMPEGGASFVIYLPIHTGAGEQSATAAPSPEKPLELWGQGKVLLVEDEDMVRAVAERALARHGYTVTTAANGDEAVEMLEGDEAFDLLISDVVMPIMDGPTLVRHAREKFPDLPVLFMSGYAEEQLRRSIDIDRVHFLPKPFSVKQIAEAAQKVLAEANALPE
jgi:two-component system cell cycle sensor histidine kinase/response regulator CckA